MTSFASLLDPDEGTSLKYVPATEINGKNCAKIDKTDVQPEINYWEHAVICRVLGANPPFSVMEGYLKRIWKSLEIDRVLMVKR